MRSITFVAEGDVRTEITITENDDGTLTFDIRVLEDGLIGDLRAIFFDLNGVDASTGEFSVIGDDVTDDAFAEEGVDTLGRDANIKGSVSNELGDFDAGVEFGTSGTSGDDIQETSFTLAWDTDGDGVSELSLDMLDLADFGLRFTSVGEEGGDRTSGAKIGDQASGVAQDDFIEVLEDEAEMVNLLTDGTADTNAADKTVTGVRLAGATEFIAPPPGGFELLDGGAVVAVVTVGADGQTTVDTTGQPGADALAAGETRDFTFEYQTTASDGSLASANVTVTVTGVNDDPTLAAGAMAADEDGSAVTLDLAALGDDDDSDDSGATLSYAVTGDPAEGAASISGTVLSFDPGGDFQDLAAGETRQVTIQVTATDSHGATAVNDVTVTVTGVNDDPVAVGSLVETNAGVVASGALTATDVDANDTLSYSLNTGSAHGVATVNADGTFSYVSDDGFSGADSFTFLVEDGEGGVETATATVNVAAEGAGELIYLSETRGGEPVNRTIGGGIDIAEVSALGDGGHIVVWSAFSSDNPDDSFFGVYMQRYNSAGEAAGGEELVNTYISGVQIRASVASIVDQTGSYLGFVVVWQNVGQDGSRSSIYGQQYDTAGAKVGAEFLINEMTAGLQTDPTVASLEGGGYVVHWSSFNDGTSITNDTFARMFDGSIDGSSGQPNAVTGEFVVNTTIPGGQVTQGNVGETTTGLNGGRFVAVWTDYNALDGSGSGIFGRLFEADGSPVSVEGSTDEFRVNTLTWGNQMFPSVGTLTDGGFVVTWSDDRADGSGWGIFAQRYGSDGAAVGSQFQVNSYTDSAQRYSKTQGLDDGGFVVIWQSLGSDGQPRNSISGQRYDASGGAVGDEFIIDNLLGDAQLPSFDVREDGAIVVVWLDGSRIEQSIIDLDGGGAVLAKNIIGTPGNDVLIGSDLDDILAGVGGDDVISGLDGADVIDGGAGADLQTGGLGADTFVLRLGDGSMDPTSTDLVSDFEDGIDLFGLADGLTFADLSISDGDSADTTISHSASGEILAVVQGMAEEDLTSGDFMVFV